ncbi:MAG: 6-phosphofructokinase [Defluviitaleaceae bacterium]|nr:6-phosphofructokinase [Defluviitaleaceae bacterium]
MVKKIGVLTSGGDAPGMNAAIRAVVRAALSSEIEVYGIYNGYAGLVNDDIRKLAHKDVGSMIDRGGTFLGSARLPEFKDPEVRKLGIANLKKHGIEAVVVIGGDGSYMGALKLTEMGTNCIALPGTIDNDIVSTDLTIGFDTALNTAVEAIDKIRDTSASHARCNVVEMMGRHCGDLSMYASIASGAEDVIISEKPFNFERIIAQIEEAKAHEKKHYLIILAELVTDAHALAKEIQVRTEIETRATILGHIQRGGAPSAMDRVLASRMGTYAVELLQEGLGGRCVGIVENRLRHFDIKTALEMSREFDESVYQLTRKLS